MLIYLSVLFLIVTPLIILVIRVARPGFSYHWLLALAGAVIAWPMLLLTGQDLPQSLQLVTWVPEAVFPSSPFLLVDKFSWPFAAGATTLLLGAILTDVARPAEVDWSIWAGELALAGLGLFAILAGNLLTLLLAWTAIDLLSLVILLGEARVPEVARLAVIQFAGRLIGSFFLLAAVIGAADPEGGLSFTPATPFALVLFLAATGLRLGLFLPIFPDRQAPLARRSLDVMIQLLPAASVLVLLARSASGLAIGGEIAPFSSGVLLLVGFVGMLAAVAWSLSMDEYEGRYLWVLGAASLALAASLRGMPEASLGWGLAAFFSAGLFLLATLRNRQISWFLLLGVAGFSALPLTPAWGGARLFMAPFIPALALFWLAHVLLLLGYARHTLRLSGSFSGLERWVVLVYPLGLGLVLLVFYWTGWRANPGPNGLPLVYWLEGPIALLAAVLGFYWIHRNERQWAQYRSNLERGFSQGWLTSGTRFGYQMLDRLVGFLTLVLEGEGGILWVLLWTLLLALLLIRP